MFKAHTGAAGRPVVILHSSDLHIDDDARLNGYTGLMGLGCVLETAVEIRADLVVLTGDTFDNGRVAATVARQAGALLAKSPVPVILLPGNHDPAGPESMFHRSGITELTQARVIGLTAPESIIFDHLELEIVGRPHMSYSDMNPLPLKAPRKARWQVVLAHGHYVPPEDWDAESHRSWRISDKALAETAADYVALGHWDRPVAIGDGTVRAYYSGSPDLARTANLIRLDQVKGVAVERVPLRLPLPPR